MELSQVIEAACHVSASYREDGEVAVKVFGCASYNEAGGMATCEVRASPEKVAALKQILASILEEAAPRLGTAMRQAIYVAQDAARRLGESQQGA